MPRLLLAACILPLAALAGQPLPEGWFLAPDASDFTAASLDGGCDHPRAVVLESKEATSGHATVMQLFQAEPFRGQRLRFSATLATREVKGWAGLWMRVDGAEPNHPLAFDTMEDRPLKGTQGCTEVSVVLDVASGAETIGAGILLEGTGHAELSGVKFEVVPASIEPTDLPNELASARGRIGSGSTGGAWFNESGVQGMGVVMRRRSPGRWSDAVDDTLATLQGEALSLKLYSYTGDFSFHRGDDALVISGTWGGYVKYPVSIRLTGEQLDMSWGFYERHLLRDDPIQADPRCARYTERRRGDVLYVCGEVLQANAPPVQTTVAFLLNGFRRPNATRGAANLPSRYWRK